MIFPQLYVLKCPALIFHMKTQQEKAINWDLGMSSLLLPRRGKDTISGVVWMWKVSHCCFFPPREVNWEGSTGDTAPGWEGTHSCPEPPRS